MVCMAFMLGTAARGAAGKILALWFPVVMFVVCGFEHCVANSRFSPFRTVTVAYLISVFFVSLGLMYGAPSTIGRLWYNQSAAMLGNLIGGAIFIGLAAHLMNHWSSPFFGGARGTLLGQDMDSTRRARETGDMEAGFSMRNQNSVETEPNETGSSSLTAREDPRVVVESASKV